MRILLLALLSGAAALSTAHGMTAIIDKLKGMQKSNKGEADEDEKAHQKHSCYCDKTIKVSSNEIANLESDIQDATTRWKTQSSVASKAEGTIGSAGEDKSSWIGLEGDIARAKQNAADEKSMRDSRYDAYNEEKTDNLQSIQSLKGAKVVLSNIGLMQMPKSFDNTVSKLTASLSHKNLNQKYMSALTSMMQSKGAGEVVGIVDTMLENLKADQGENDDKEKTQAEDYNAFVQANRGRMDDLDDALAQAQAAQGESQGDAAEAKKLMGTLTAELEAKRAFLAETRKNCQTNREAYSDRVQDRSKEMEGITKAIGILANDDARKQFNKVGMFVQTASVAKVLRKVNSPRLSLLATQVGKSAFQEVVYKLKDQAKAIKKERDAEFKRNEKCKKAIAAGELEKTTQVGNSRVAAQKASSSAETAAEMKARVAKKREDIANDKQQNKEAAEDRNFSNAAYNKARIEGAQMKATLSRAKRVLEHTYELQQVANNQPILDTEAVMQQFDKLHDAKVGFAGLQTLLGDDKPEDFKEYERNSGEGNVVIQLLVTEISNVDHKMKNLRKDEEEQQKDYEEQTISTATDIQTAEQAAADFESTMGSAQMAESKANKDKMAADRSVDAQSKTLETHHEACDFLLKNFNTRQDNFQKEREAVLEAVQILSNA